MWISAKKIILLLLALVMCLTAIVGMIAVQMEMDLQSYIGEAAWDALRKEAEGTNFAEIFLVGVYRETGFDLLSGKSDFIQSIDLMNRLIAESESEGQSVWYEKFYWFENVAQAVNFFVLFGSAFAIILAALGLTARQSFAAMQVSAVLALLFGIVYLAEGYIFLWIVRTNYENIFKFFGAEVATEKLFFTYSYIPFIVIALTNVVFWCICGFMREPKKPVMMNDLKGEMIWQSNMI